MINELILLGFGTILDQLTIEEMFGHYMTAKNKKALEMYQSKEIDNDKHPFSYPFAI